MRTVNIKITLTSKCIVSYQLLNCKKNLTWAINFLTHGNQKNTMMRVAAQWECNLISCKMSILRGIECKAQISKNNYVKQHQSGVEKFTARVPTFGVMSTFTNDVIIHKTIYTLKNCFGDLFLLATWNCHYSINLSIIAIGYHNEYLYSLIFHY